jgi:hypothetical protein
MCCANSRSGINTSTTNLTGRGAYQLAPFCYNLLDNLTPLNKSQIAGINLNVSALEGSSVSLDIEHQSNFCFRITANTYAWWLPWVVTQTRPHLAIPCVPVIHNNVVVRELIFNCYFSIAMTITTYFRHTQST